MKIKINKENSSFLTNIGITFLTRLLSFIFGFALSILLARILGPKLRGIYAITVLIPTLMVKFGSLGIETSNIYFAGNNRYRPEILVFNSLFLSVIFGVSLILIFSLALKFDIFKNYLDLNNVNLRILWIAILTVPFSLFTIFVINVILGKERILLYNVLSLLRLFIQLLLLVLFLIFLNLRLRGAILSYAITIFNISIIYIIVVINLWGLRFVVDKKLVLKLVKYGLKAYFGNIAQFLNYRLDIFLVSAFLSPVDVGYYSVSVGIAEKIWMLPGAVSTILFPRVSNVDSSTANDLTPKVVRTTFFVVIVFSIFLFIFAKPIIKILYGKDYLPSILPLLMLLPGIVALSVSKTLTADLAGRGMPQFGAYSSFVSLVLNLPINLVLIPKWGISGAAFASSVAYICATIVVIYYFLRKSNGNFFKLIFIQKEDIKDLKKIAKRLNLIS